MKIMWLDGWSVGGRSSRKNRGAEVFGGIGLSCRGVSPEESV